MRRPRGVEPLQQGGPRLQGQRALLHGQLRQGGQGQQIYRYLDTWDDTQVRGQDLVTRNLKRVVEVWLDEQHKQYFYTRHPLHK